MTRQHRIRLSAAVGAVSAALLLMPTAPALAESESPKDLAEAVAVDETPQQAELPVGITAFAENAPSCTDSEHIRVCVNLGAPVDETAAEADGAQIQPLAVAALPQWCLDAGATNSYLGTRTEVCGIFSGNLQVFEIINGQPGPVTGSMNFLLYNYVYMNTSLNRWANQMQVSPYTITGTAAGTQIWGSASCGGAACTLVSQSFPTQTPGLHANANGESYWDWNGASGQAGYGTPEWTVTFKAPSTNTASSIMRTAPQVRCDNAVPGRAVAGCVVPGITPRITYDGNSFVEFGQHVAGAQASGLKGSSASGQPLHRLTDAVATANNRNTACPASLIRPPGKSCDEYPFASTYEGAALSGGGPRTQSWCQVPLSGSPSTGSAGYSVCMINAAENSQAGSLLNSVLYSPYRVIDGDAFHINVVY